ncbi:MAG: hypothetical protein KAJ75_08875 [Alphaproteobacteria bacterium]|nr:hypothetical protein [Alphaproteobacteria bacterium]
MLEKKDDFGEIYDFLESENGQLLLVISINDEEPNNPEIICNNSNSATFCRNNKSSIFLPDMHPDVIPALKASKYLEVVEMKGSKIARYYEASISITKKTSLH